MAYSIYPELPVDGSEVSTNGIDVKFVITAGTGVVPGNPFYKINNQAKVYGDYELESSSGISYITFHGVLLEYGENTIVMGITESYGTDATGQVTVTATFWDGVKTDWQSTDKFNMRDFNRIKHNIYALQELTKEIYGRPAPLSDMGDELYDPSRPWDVEYFNALEDNVESLNDNYVHGSYGQKQIFFENGPFITYSELNRLESAIDDMRRFFLSQKTAELEGIDA